MGGSVQMGESVTIGYDSLFDLLRREKSREDLSKLEDSFYTDVAHFLKEQERTLFDASAGSDYERVKIQIHNVKKILRELYDRRERKILSLAVYKVRAGTSIIDVSALLPEEQVFFERSCQLLSQGREGILEPVLAGKNAVLELLHGVLLPKTVTISSPSNESDSTSATPIAGSPGEAQVSDEEQIKVRMLYELPEFLGRDLRVYGPFKLGDVAMIPKSIAQVLLTKEAANVVE